MCLLQILMFIQLVDRHHIWEFLKVKKLFIGWLGWVFWNSQHMLCLINKKVEWEIRAKIKFIELDLCLRKHLQQGVTFQKMQNEL